MGNRGKSGEGKKNQANPSEEIPSANTQKEENALPCHDLTPRPANKFPVTYRKERQLTDAQMDRIKKAVEEGGIALGTDAYMNMESLPTLLSTDRKGALIYVDDNLGEEKIKNLSGSTFIPTPELIMELTKRSHAPRSATQREKLLQARDNVEDFSDNPVLRRERIIRKEQNDRDMSRIKKKILERSPAVSELSGRPLEGDAEVHHLRRVADNPEQALDPENMMVLKRDEHQEFHRSGYPPTPEGLRKYAEEHREEWNVETEEGGEKG